MSVMVFLRLVAVGVLDRLWVTARDKNIGSVSMSGITSWIHRIGNTYDAALSFAGDVTAGLSGEWHSYPIGNLSPAGVYTRLINLWRTYISELDLSGAIDRLINVFKSKDGDLSFTGESAGSFIPSDWKLGYLTFAGIASRVLHNLRTTQESNLAFAGGISKAVVVTRSASGVLDLSGYSRKAREKIYLGPPNY
jgi:hypothetical protein